MKHVWQIFLFLAVLVSVCCTGCERKQAMEIEEETFPVVSSVAEESGEAYKYSVYKQKIGHRVSDKMKNIFVSMFCTKKLYPQK